MPPELRWRRPARNRQRLTPDFAASSLARSSPSLGPEFGRILSQLETGRTDADYGEPSITREEATDAISKAERLVDAVEGFLGAGTNS